MNNNNIKNKHIIHTLPDINVTLLLHSTEVFINAMQ